MPQNSNIPEKAEEPEYNFMRDGLIPMLKNAFPWLLVGILLVLVIFYAVKYTGTLKNYNEAVDYINLTCVRAVKGVSII